MKNKNKVIIILLVVAVVIFSSALFYFISNSEKNQEEYEISQQSALTHDITSIQDCRSPYIGDHINTVKLFDKLPLNNVEKKYEIDSEDCKLTVYYLEVAWNIGEDKVKEDLVYNTIAAMASIDNLSSIDYEFAGDSFLFTREDIEKVFGEELSRLLDENVWKTEVQNKIEDEDFLSKFYI